MMSASKLLNIAPFFFFFFLLNLRLYSCFDNNAIILCPGIEKQALLGLKQSLSDPLDHIISSWNAETNCCSWKGVFCSNFSGHVHQLRLRGYDLTGKLNSSLLNLKYLRYLDLSSNNFSGDTIPSFIGPFTNLRYLNLSYSDFVGTIPQTMGNLSNLNALSLEGLYGINSDNIEWLLGLYQLVHLNMNYVDLNKATNWLQVVNKLSTLKELHLYSCNLDVLPALDIVNMSSLSILDLFGNNFNSFIPRWIFQLSNLIHLDLGFNNFHGAIPNASHTIKLQRIDISHNILKSTIPNWFYLCTDLVFVDFSANYFLHDTISSDIGNLSSLSYLRLELNDLSGTMPREIGNLNKMLDLSVYANKLGGEIPYSLGNMSNLENIDLEGNHLSGALPASFGFLSNLKVMSLSYNQLVALPTCFGNMLKLESMDISDNKLVAALPILFANMSNLGGMDLHNNQLAGASPISFGNLTNLESLDLRYNHLSALPASLATLSSLKSLFLSSNNLSGNFSESLGHLFNLKFLYIDDNKLRGIVSENNLANLTSLTEFVASGNLLTLKVKRNWIPPFQLEKLGLQSWNLGPNAEIPSWLETQKNLVYLDLSNTGISGTFPHWIWNIAELNLSHNNLHGKRPHVIGNGLLELVLSSNRLSGPLPQVSDALQVLDLSNNSFNGGMSHFLCGTENTTNQMSLLLLNDNQLTGELPDCWMSWPIIFQLNLGNNNFSGRIPNSLGIAEMRSLNLYGNKFSGQVPRSLLNCTGLRQIDLSNNAFDGNIPSWMGIALSNLVILIVQSNKLSGNIPLELCHLQNLQIFDLSNNQFSGAVPGCFDNYTTMVKKNRSLEVLSLDAYAHPVWLEISVSIITKGQRMRYDTFLALVTHINLAKNNFSGEIPKQITRLVELISLNLSGNHLTGTIPGDIGNMNGLESLDLSSNSLVGEIPNSVTMMSSLSYLNLSYNDLTGKIPKGTQLHGMDPSSFLGNNLCGPPLPHNCGNDQSQFPKSSDNHDREDDKSEVQWLFVFTSLGYAMGLSATFSILVLKKSWRLALFAFVEHMWDETYVYFYFKWKRLQRRFYQGSSGHV